jgi:hypothetical protein
MENRAPLLDRSISFRASGGGGRPVQLSESAFTVGDSNLWGLVSSLILSAGRMTGVIHAMPGPRRRRPQASSAPENSRQLQVDRP